MNRFTQNPINLIEKDKEVILTNSINNFRADSSLSSYQDVFVTRSGIGMKNFKILTDTIPHYAGKFKHLRNYTYLQYLLRPKDKLEGQYLLIHNHWCPGYFHWITEAIPRLLRSYSLINSCKILLPEKFPSYAFESLEVFNPKLFLIPQNKNLKIEKLYIPENTRFTAVYDKKNILKMRSIFHSYLIDNKLSSLNLGTKIYVSRKKAAKRKITNEDEVIQYLVKKGFKVIHFENYSFWEQVSIMYHTKILISIHGAGLTNQIFMQSHSVVFELQKIVQGNENYSNIYLKLANVLNHKYLYQFCIPKNNSENIYDADLIVDLEVFEKNVSLIN